MASSSACSNAATSKAVRRRSSPRHLSRLLRSTARRRKPPTTKLSNNRSHESTEVIRHSWLSYLPDKSIARAHREQISLRIGGRPRPLPPMSINQRQHIRFSLDIPAIYSRFGEKQETRLEQISIGGCFM